MKPCRICHYYLSSEIHGHPGLCVFWNWPVSDEVDGTNTVRALCIGEGARCLPKGKSDPHTSKLEQRIDPIQLAERHWQLDGHKQIQTNLLVTKYVALTGLALAFIGLLIDFYS